MPTDRGRDRCRSIPLTYVPELVDRWLCPKCNREFPMATPFAIHGFRCTKVAASVADLVADMRQRGVVSMSIEPKGNLPNRDAKRRRVVLCVIGAALFPVMDGPTVNDPELREIEAPEPRAWQGEANRAYNVDECPRTLGACKSVNTVSTLCGSGWITVVCRTCRAASRKRAS